MRQNNTSIVNESDCVWRSTARAADDTTLTAARVPNGVPSVSNETLHLFRLILEVQFNDFHSIHVFFALRSQLQR